MHKATGTKSCWTLSNLQSWKAAQEEMTEAAFRNFLVICYVFIYNAFWV